MLAEFAAMNTMHTAMDQSCIALPVSTLRSQLRDATGGRSSSTGTSAPILSGTLGIPDVSMPLIGVGIAFAVLAVAAVATWIPARRAATVNPVTALRAE